MGSPCSSLAWFIRLNPLELGLGRDESRTGLYEEGWRKKWMLHRQPTMSDVQVLT